MARAMVAVFLLSALHACAGEGFSLIQTAAQVAVPHVRGGSHVVSAADLDLLNAAFVENLVTQLRHLKREIEMEVPARRAIPLDRFDTHDRATLKDATTTFKITRGLVDYLEELKSNKSDTDLPVNVNPAEVAAHLNMLHSKLHKRPDDVSHFIFFAKCVEGETQHVRRVMHQLRTYTAPVFGKSSLNAMPYAEDKLRSGQCSSDSYEKSDGTPLLMRECFSGLQGWVREGDDELAETHLLLDLEAKMKQEGKSHLFGEKNQLFLCF